MTGKFARLLVGSCMTAALSVSGFLGTTPAAHAGGGSTATCSVIVVNVVCIGNIGINHNNVEIDIRAVWIDQRNAGLRIVFHGPAGIGMRVRR